MKKLYIVLVAIFLSGSIYAQAPELMSYQAIIRGADDALIQNGDIGIRISILQGSDTGTSVYTETHTTTTNDNGLVTLDIGSGATSDDFSTIDWSTGSYYIKSETDPNGGTNYTIEGTSQLLSVPYALYAKTSGSSSQPENPLPNTSVNHNTNTSFAFKSLDENKIFAWSSNSENWAEVQYQNTTYGASDITPSNGNFAFKSLDENKIYAWSFSTYQWHSVTYPDTAYGASDIIPSNGNFVFNSLDENKIYAWNANDGTWTGVTYQNTSYGASSIIESNGNFAFNSLDENKIYAWGSSTGTWNSVTYPNTAYGASSITTSNGNFIFNSLDENKVYVWNAFTGAWTSATYQNTSYGIGTIISSEQNSGN